MNDLKATGRPKQQVPILPRIGLTLALAVLLLEALVQVALHHLPLGPLAQHMAPLVPLLQRYAYARRWVIEHPVASACILAALVALALFIVRWCLLFWHISICNGGPLIGPFPKLHSAVDWMNFPYGGSDGIAACAARAFCLVIPRDFVEAALAARAPCSNAATGSEPLHATFY